MIGFLLKKTFFDLWDNLFRVAFINLGFILSLALSVLLLTLSADVTILFYAIILICILWCSVYLSAAALCLSAISDYKTFGFADFFKQFKSAWPAGLAFGLIVFVIVFISSAVIPFYLSMESMLGLLLASIIFWTFAAAILSFQFFFAIRSRLDTKLSKIIKKSFIIFLDNPGFAIFSLLHNTVILILSIFLALLFPGPAGILLYLDEALRLRLLKYDYLEANPDANRRKIPWDALLIDEREKTGDRSLKSFIFPWKD
ncbi:MAG: hypothetical protein LBV20_00155 [Treponema sp.]|jgi:hypothetical protein|nr:hypothetical protein [Treponema sp.]